MNSKVFKLSLIAAGILLGSAGQANATDTMTSALGGQVVYDATTNLSWIANANLMATNTFGLTYGTNYGTDVFGNPSVINSDGTATWGGAMKWVATMDAAHYLGYSDWSLPTADPSAGVNYESTSQMGNLFYNGLGQSSNQTIGTTHIVNYNLFNNVQSTSYWSGTEYALNPNLAWRFNTSIGYQSTFGKNFATFALAVRPGQVAAVPEPGEWLLMISGFGLTGFLARLLKKTA